MKSEISAGGIVVRKRGKVWEVLVLRDMNNALTFPKGLIEKGETPETAAKREIAEEVGVTSLHMLKKLPSIAYMYERHGLISKKVHYFLFLFSGHERLRAQKEEGIHDATWMSIDRAMDEVGYAKTNKPLLIRVKQWISNPRQTYKK